MANTGQGNYDHPGYLTRQLDYGTAAKVSNGTATIFAAANSNVRVRTLALYPVGTGTASENIAIQNGTTSIASLTLTSSGFQSWVCSTDLNTTLYALMTASQIIVSGTTTTTATPTSLVIKTPTDTNLQVTYCVEYHIDPASTWT